MLTAVIILSALLHFWRAGGLLVLALVLAVALLPFRIKAAGPPSKSLGSPHRGPICPGGTGGAVGARSMERTARNQRLCEGQAVAARTGVPWELRYRSNTPQHASASDLESKSADQAVRRARSVEQHGTAI